jgi:Phosphoglucomutase/phosphomannomutase, alpha/beta/alpha domain I
MTWFPIPNARPSLFPKPSPQLLPNTYAYESRPMVKPTGFREYDARWIFEKEISLMGAQTLGLGLARLLKELGVPRDVLVGHDFRSYSAAIKLAMTAGLMAGGAQVRDIGLAITPMAYFAQFALDTPAVAMVTASHNDNGWTGVKMGASRPVTFGPEEMARLRDIVIAGEYGYEAGGGYEFVADFPARYIADLTARPKVSHGLKVIAACGNGAAGAFAQAPGRARRRGRSPRLRSRLHLPSLQSESRFAEDLGFADNVAALRRRGQIRCRGSGRRTVQGDASARRAAGWPADSRPNHRQWRQGHRRGRRLGARARVVEQAGTRGRHREPGVGSGHAGDVRLSRPGPAREPRGRGLQPDDLIGDEASGPVPVLPDLVRPGLIIISKAQPRPAAEV